MSVSSAAPVDRDVGINLYRNAAGAFVQMGRQFRSQDWDCPSACTAWDATALAGHVVCVARWHHEWLDRAEAGRTSPPWPPEELSVRNEAALDRLNISGGPSRIVAFEAEARRYADRLGSTWELPFWYPGGLVTVGMHAVLAAGEWHLHTWDLGRAIGVDHQTDGAIIRSAWLQRGRRIAEDGDPWSALLEASGRNPT